jgi:DNA-binding response OmpR family regulator
MNLHHHRPILIVEDNDEDFEATMWALRKSRFEVPIIRCKDGEDALSYLENRQRSGEEKTSPVPAIILLDLNLPRTDGREVLKRIKTSVRLSSLPVVVVTTSASNSDVEASYKLGANSYVVKPVSMVKLREMVEGLIEYWFLLVRLPQSEGRDGS